MKNLFSEFNPTDKATWKQRLEKDLRGITFEMLQTTNSSNIAIQPFYTIEDRPENSTALFTHTEWNILTEINVADEKTANKLALEQLSNGATGLIFKLKENTNLHTLLNEILIQHIQTVFKVEGDVLVFAENFKSFIQKQNLGIDTLETSIVYNPIVESIKSGDSIQAHFAEKYISFLQQTDGVYNICVDASIFCNAGANSAYQLSLCIAQFNEYLNILDNNEQLSLIKNISITLAVGTQFFEEIAKLRALYILLPLLFEQYNISPNVHLNIKCSTIYKSPLDVYNNLLRDSIAAMAAIAGGCHSLCISHFNPVEDAAESFGMRMSRNIQLILKEESYLDKFSDFGAGSHFIENLTEKTAQQAWTHFQEIEQDGGLLKSFKYTIKENIQKQAEQLVNDYKSGKRILIGVNKYPNPKDNFGDLKQFSTKTKGLSPINLTEELLNN